VSYWYTNFELDWDYILLSCYEDGVKKNKRIKLHPYLFIPSALDNAKYTTIDNKAVSRVDFKSVKEAREFVRSYSGAGNFKVYGTPLYQYVYIYDNFSKQEVDRSQIKVLNYDIEVDTTTGYPTHNMADKPINAVTVKIFGSKDVYALGMWDYNPDNPEPEIQKLLAAGYRIFYKKCEDEKDIIRSFYKIWDKLQPDVVTGWNIKLFDIPYVVKRAALLFGAEFSEKLSPFGKLKHSEVTLFNRLNDCYDIVGVPTLDYMDIYKKFSMGVEESYSLNYLSNKILGASKLDYSEWGSLAKLQEGDSTKFMNYNIIDVIRVEQIDEKIKYMDIAFEIAYETLTNYSDSLTTIRVWDTMIHNYLMDRNIVVPHSSDNRKDRTIAGGHVKEPHIGKHKWVMSFDFKSLYPHLCMTFNISPDTYLGTLKDVVGTTSVEKIMAGEVDEIHELLVKKNVTVTGAGTIFSRSKQGFIPAIMEHLFNLRSVYSAKEDERAKLLQKVREEKIRRGLM
jgi:DNA polymerase elongation subunit (family B)